MSYEDGKIVKLEEIVNDISMGPFGSDLKVENFVEKGIPVIKGQNLNDRGFEGNSFSYVTEEKAQSLKRCLAYPDDLVFTHRGTIGQVAIIPRDRYPYYLVSQSQMKLTVNPDFLHPRYLLYFFKSAVGQYELLKNASQVGVPAIASPTKSLKDVEIFLPPLSTQRRIAAILTALDDKIELNYRMNETLEGIAQAVWGEWFGKYANGEDDLPDGWRWGNILEIANLMGGGTPKTDIEEYWSGDIPWISAKDVTPNNRSIIIETEKKITKDGLENSSAKLLPALSTVISARGTVGNYCLIPSEMTISQSNYALKSIEENTDFFLFQQVANLVAEMQQKSYGTVFDTITTKTFSEIEIPIPPVSNMVEYNETMRSVFERRLENLWQSHILAAMRNILLPRLMRGDIKV